MLLRGFLKGRYAPLLTHLTLAALFAAMIALLVKTPFWLALVPCALLHHRVGILLHEYVHGIPFRGRERNLLTLSVFDGLLISFGMLEVFRVSHLAHHTWLNTERDPAAQAEKDKGRRVSLLGLLRVLEFSQHAGYFVKAWKGGNGAKGANGGNGGNGGFPGIKRSRIVLGFLQSVAWISFWVYVGLPWMVAKLLLLNVITSLSSSLRGAVEHHSRPDDTNFSNEYRVLIPLFNLNRHLDHHLHPTRPWYRREFVTGKPLPPVSYWTYWYRVYVKREYVLMPPPGSTAQ
jgi:fatty acid desaturase